ncbi:hypothetical protein BJ170DRAFT_622518 [Xylariales sp. AK1849]|nr:hypothetical protein BJ170DRAFT_622518 [Xylariales sp. AK1849]
MALGSSIDEGYWSAADGCVVKLSDIITSKTIHTNIRCTYTQWTPREAFRELVQNWRDGIIKSFDLDEQEFELGTKRLKLDVMKPRHWYNVIGDDGKKGVIGLPKPRDDERQRGTKRKSNYFKAKDDSVSGTVCLRAPVRRKT